MNTTTLEFIYSLQKKYNINEADTAQLLNELLKVSQTHELYEIPLHERPYF